MFSLKLTMPDMDFKRHNLNLVWRFMLNNEKLHICGEKLCSNLIEESHHTQKFHTIFETQSQFLAFCRFNLMESRTETPTELHNHSD